MKYVTAVYRPDAPKQIAIYGSTLQGGEVSAEFRAKAEAEGFVVERRSVMRLRIESELRRPLRSRLFTVRHRLWWRVHRHIFRTGHMYTDERAALIWLLSFAVFVLAVSLITPR